MADTLHSTEKLSVAALISVMLRRKISRTIDIKWLIENEAYAKSIVALARAQGFAELNEHADHFEMLMFGKLSKTSPKPDAPVQTNIDLTEIKKSSTSTPENDADNTPEIADSNTYIGGLR